MEIDINLKNVLHCRSVPLIYIPFSLNFASVPHKLHCTITKQITSSGVKDKKIHELEMKFQQHTQTSSEPSIQGQKLVDPTSPEFVVKIHSTVIDLVQGFQKEED